MGSFRTVLRWPGRRADRRSEGKIPLYKLVEKTASLEDIFIELTSTDEKIEEQTEQESVQKENVQEEAVPEETEAKEENEE